MIITMRRRSFLLKLIVVRVPFDDDVAAAACTYLKFSQANPLSKQFNGLKNKKGWCSFL